MYSRINTQDPEGKGLSIFDAVAEGVTDEIDVVSILACLVFDDRDLTSEDARSLSSFPSQGPVTSNTAQVPSLPICLPEQSW